MKGRLSEIKASFLSVTAEVDSEFSNNAADLLMVKLEHISGMIKEMESVLKHPQNTMDRDALEKLLDSFSERKDEYQKVFDKCKMIQLGEKRIVQLEKKVKVLEEILN